MSRTIVVHYTWDHSALHALSRRSASLSLSSFTIRWRWINSAGQTQTSGEDNACVCRDAHLGPGDLKIWGLPILHFTLHTPPPRMSTAPPDPRFALPTNWPSRYGLGHHMKVLHITWEVLYWRNDLCQWLNACKNVPKTEQWIKKVRILRKKMGFKFQTKTQKWQKSILSCRFGDPYGKAGDQCRIRESWKGSFRALARAQIPLSPSSFKALFTMGDGKLP